MRATMQSNKDKCSKKQRNIRNKNHSITLIEADSRPKQTPTNTIEKQLKCSEENTSTKPTCKSPSTKQTT